MKSMVIYRSKTGFSQKYASWIAKEINADIISGKKATINQLLQYDNIIYCGSLYAGGILGFNFIKKNFDKIKDKKIITVAVGATIKKDEAVEEIKNKNFTSEMKGKVKLFLLRGGLNYKKMHVLDRFLMFMLIKSIKRQKKDQTDIEAKAMVATYGKNVDFTDEKSIKPIIDYINNKDN